MLQRGASKGGPYGSGGVLVIVAPGLKHFRPKHGGVGGVGRVGGVSCVGAVDGDGDGGGKGV